MAPEMLRYNAGKPQLSLVPTAFLIAIGSPPGGPFYGPKRLIREVARVLTYGAAKYSPNNWRTSGSWLKVLDSGMRHVDAYLTGQEVDDESGIHHFGHLGCNLAFLLEFIAQSDGTDDRYRVKKMMDYDAPGGSFGEVIENILIWRDGGDHSYLRRATRQLAELFEEYEASNSGGDTGGMVAFWDTGLFPNLPRTGDPLWDDRTVIAQQQQFQNTQGMN